MSNAEMDSALHVMPEPPGPSMAEIMALGAPTEAEIDAVAPKLGPRFVNLDAYRDKFPAPDWLALQAFVEEVETHAGRDEMQRLVDLAVEAADYLAPGRFTPFLDHMRTVAMNRRADLIIADLEAVVKAFPAGLITAADRKALAKVDARWRVQEIGNVARQRLAASQPNLFAQPAQAKEASVAAPASQTPPETTTASQEINRPNDSTPACPECDQPMAYVAGPGCGPSGTTFTCTTCNGPDYTTEPELLAQQIESKGDQPMPAVLDDDTVAAYRQAAKRIRDHLKGDEIKDRLRSFLPAGADPGRLVDLMKQKQVVSREIKALKAEQKRREVELEAIANVPQVDAEGKPIKLTVDQRKARFNQSLLDDAEYQAIQAQIAQKEGEADDLGSEHEAAKEEVRIWRDLKEIYCAELLVLGGY